VVLKPDLDEAVARNRHSPAIGASSNQSAPVVHNAALNLATCALCQYPSDTVTPAVTVRVLPTAATALPVDTTAMDVAVYRL
jgi:hypothetical protein